MFLLEIRGYIGIHLFFAVGPCGIEGGTCRRWATAAAAVGRGGSPKRLYKAPTDYTKPPKDYTKPRQTLQRYKNTVQRLKISDKTHKY